MHRLTVHPTGTCLARLGAPHQRRFCRQMRVIPNPLFSDTSCLWPWSKPAAKTDTQAGEMYSRSTDYLPDVPSKPKARSSGPSEEVTFSALPGVINTRVGYTGGDTPAPTYRSVCGGDGHTEAIKIEFDPKVLSYEQLLKVFFESHSPTSRSWKPQYKSAIWTANDAQVKTAQDAIAVYEKRHNKKVRTDVAPAKAWHDAEEYHQQYCAKMSGAY